ncbi:hypothetical protein [Saccharothrix sp. NRRL B-16348]|uniref:hypothetical protein n=1 Tax=Saccharothrix sp. NRRL B-16348 TaxID=1415542 RepID=UPI0006B05FB9|nr:hypothetical protein [Saccharothrix sp. NRRL B-16348]
MPTSVQSVVYVSLVQVESLLLCTPLTKRLAYICLSPSCGSQAMNSFVSSAVSTNRSVMVDSGARPDVCATIRVPSWYSENTTGSAGWDSRRTGNVNAKDTPSTATSDAATAATRRRREALTLAWMPDMRGPWAASGGSSACRRSTSVRSVRFIAAPLPG